MGAEVESDSNQRTKECVKPVPRVFRVPGGEKPTSLSQFPKVETTDSNYDIEYEGNQDKIYNGSAWCVLFFNV